MLEWMEPQGYKKDVLAVVNAILANQKEVLLWLQDHDMMAAKIHENTPLLKWLIENRCPYDIAVLRFTASPELVVYLNTLQ